MLALELSARFAVIPSRIPPVVACGLRPAWPKIKLDSATSNSSDAKRQIEARQLQRAALRFLLNASRIDCDISSLVRLQSLLGDLVDEAFSEVFFFGESSFFLSVFLLSAFSASDSAFSAARLPLLA